MKGSSNSALDALVASVEGSNNSNGEYERVGYLEMKSEGKYRVRVLPRKDDETKYPANRKFKHSGFIDPNRNKMSVFACLGKDCPLCAEYRELEASGDAGAWRKKSKMSYDYYVQDANGNFKIFEATKTLHEQIEAEFLAKAKAERVNIFDLENGHDIEITRRGTGKETKWSVKVFPTPTAVSLDVIDSLNKARSLEEIQRINTPEELDMVIKGVAWRKPKEGSEKRKDSPIIQPQAEQKKASAKPEVKTQKMKEPEILESVEMPDFEEDDDFKKMRAEIFGSEKK